MELPELRPRHRNHLGGGIQFHRARSQRDHPVHQREVTALQRVQIAQHLRLAAIPMEYRMCEKRRDPPKAFVEAGVGIISDVVEREVRHIAAIKHRPQIHDVGRCRGFVKRDGQCTRREHAKIQAMRLGGRQDVFLTVGTDLHADRVEVILVRDREAQLLEPRRQRHGESMHAPGNAKQALGAVIDRVHARHHGEQHLRRAHVTGGLLATDMLLAGLQGHAQRRLAVRVTRHTDNTTRQQALELIARGKERRVRSAESHWHTKPLRAPHSNVGAPFSRRCEQAERQ